MEPHGPSLALALARAQHAPDDEPTRGRNMILFAVSARCAAPRSGSKTGERVAKYKVPAKPAVHRVAYTPAPSKSILPGGQSQSVGEVCVKDGKEQVNGELNRSVSDSRANTRGRETELMHEKSQVVSYQEQNEEHSSAHVTARRHESVEIDPAERNLGNH